MRQIDNHGWTRHCDSEHPISWPFRLQTRTLGGRWVTIASGDGDTIRAACAAMQNAALYARVINEANIVVVNVDASDDEAR